MLKKIRFFLSAFNHLKTGKRIKKGLFSLYLRIRFRYFFNGSGSVIFLTDPDPSKNNGSGARGSRIRNTALEKILTELRKSSLDSCTQSWIKMPVLKVQSFKSEGLHLANVFVRMFCHAVNCFRENEVGPKDAIRCRECGYRILYKKRTKRLIVFDAR